MQSSEFPEPNDEWKMLGSKKRTKKRFGIESKFKDSYKPSWWSKTNTSNSWRPHKWYVSERDRDQAFDNLTHDTKDGGWYWSIMEFRKCVR